MKKTEDCCRPQSPNPAAIIAKLFRLVFMSKMVLVTKSAML